MKRRSEPDTGKPLSLDLAAAGMAVVVLFIWAFLLFKKYYSFGYCDWDLAFFSQGMYGLLKGKAYSSLFETTIFGNHANLIAFLIAPLFALIPHPLTLVVLKISSYSLAGLILYHMASARLGKPYALGVLFLYYAYLPNVFGLLHDFDFESLSPVFLMAMIFFFERRDWRAFILTSLLTMTIKENMPLVVAAFGLSGFVVAKDKIRWGVIPLLAGGAVFVFLVKFLIPFMSTGSCEAVHPYSYQYLGLWQHGISGAATYFKSMIFSFNNLRFIQDILGVLLFLPCLAFGALFPAVPLLLQHALSSAVTQHSIRFYYVLSIAPFVFYALIIVLERFRNIFRRSSLILLFICSLAGYSLQWQSYWPAVQQSFRCYACQRPTEKTINGEWALLHSIPFDAGVMATFAYLTPLADHPYLYAFHKLYLESFQVPGHQWQIPSKVKYALIDLDDPWLYPYAPVDQNEKYAFVLRLLGGVDHWTLVSQAGTTVLLTKKE